MKVLDLFSGIGGFSLGLERAGFKTVAFCEQDKHCQKVLKRHWPGIPIYDDVKTLKGKQFPGIDLICGGFPCQDISVAGNKKGLEGERSGLWGEFKRIIKEVEPRYAIIENVANLRNIGLQTLLKDLWAIGYASEWHIISARSVGACHLRERIWIIAYPQGHGNRRQSNKLGKEVERKEKQKIGTKFNHQGENIRADGGSIQRRGQGILQQSPHPNMSRLWKPFASEKEKSEWWAKTTTSFRDWWETQPSIRRTNDGLPRGLDTIRRERIKMLGNSVVPFIPEILGREILKYEKSLEI